MTPETGEIIMTEAIEEQKSEERVLDRPERAIPKESDRESDPAELKAASDTDPKRLASAILAKFHEHGYAHIRAIGPAAIGKGTSACDIARSKLSLAGIEAIQHGFFWEIELKKVDPKTGKKAIKTGHTTVCEPR